MATCSLLGQAVGTAAAVAVRHRTTPRGVYQSHLAEVQQALQWDDSYLPFRPRAATPLTVRARLTASAGDPEALRNGWDRQIGDQRNSWDAGPGDWVTLEWDQAVALSGVRLAFDPDLSRTVHNMVSYYTLAPQNFSVPPSLVKAFSVELLTTGGAWVTAVVVADNHQRLVLVPLAAEARALRFRAQATWGSPQVRVFALDAY
jgi:hypothetical protein